jgi:hypothetical protein
MEVSLGLQVRGAILLVVEGCHLAEGPRLAASTSLRGCLAAVDARPETKYDVRGPDACVLKPCPAFTVTAPSSWQKGDEGDGSV